MERKDFQGETIDLKKLLSIAVIQKKIIALILIFCTSVALLTAAILPKQWQSKTMVQIRSTGAGNLGGIATMASAMGISLSGNSSASPTNYIELMKSRTVLQPIIDDLDWGEEKGKPSPEVFAQKYLDIQNTKQTNLINVIGKGRSPEEAQMISKSVVDNFLLMQTNMNQQTQSLLVTFLNSRIETSKKEAEDAAKKLADYSREHKIYNPDGQASAAIEQLNAYDKAISDMQVKQKASQAQYEVATQQIGEQRAGALDYNINDNATVQSIRSQIIAQEVLLVSYQQKFTDSNPELIAAQQKLAQLNKSLSDEVSAIVNSNAASLNSAQLSMMTNQATAQAEFEVAKESENALRTIKEEKQKKIDNLPDEVMNYVQLDSDAKIKMQVYTALVQQCEQDKIQEAMESMDVQIIDPANLPTGHTFPDRNMFFGAGLLVGIILSFYYCMVIYKRES